MVLFKFSELGIPRQHMLYLVIHRPTMVQLPHLQQRQHMGKCHQWSALYRRIVLFTSPLSTLIPISIITDQFITLRLERPSMLRVRITQVHHFIVSKIVIINNTMDISNH